MKCLVFIIIAIPIGHLIKQLNCGLNLRFIALRGMRHQTTMSVDLKVCLRLTVVYYYLDLNLITPLELINSLLI